MAKSASTLPIIEVMSESKPLYMDMIIMSAAVPTAMPTALIAEIMFITLCDFLATRRFISARSLFLQKLLDVFHIVEGTVEEEIDFGYYPELFPDP